MSALDAIRKLSADYETTQLAGDGQVLARLFGQDAVIIPPDKAAIEGRKRIDEFFSGVTGADQPRSSARNRAAASRSALMAARRRAASGSSPQRSI